MVDTSCSSVVVVNLLEEFVKMSLLVLQEFELLLTLLIFYFFTFSIALLDGLDLGLELNDLVLLFGLSGLEVGDSLLEISLTVFGLELLAHSEGDGTIIKTKTAVKNARVILKYSPLVKSLVGGNSHLDFISDSDQ